MELIKRIHNENKKTKLIDYLEMLRIDGIVYEHYEVVQDFLLKYVECVEYTLNEDITEILKPTYDTIRIETDYFAGNFILTRVYIK